MNQSERIMQAIGFQPKTKNNTTTKPKPNTENKQQKTA